MLMLILAAAFIAGAAYFVLEATTLRQKQMVISLRRAKRYGGASARDAELCKGMSERVLAPSLESLARIAMRLPMTAAPDELRRRLIAAGLGQRITPMAFLALKAGLSIGTFVFGFLLSLAGVLPPSSGLLFAIAGLALGFMLPDMYLTMQTRKRKEQILVQLPDILDLLCVSVEAGLGFDAALAKLSERMRGPLVEEMSIMLGEMRIGEARQQALKNFADRLELPETTSFARSIIQADQLGISLGRVLRVQAADMRNKRQMAAENKAMKAPIKMLFPTVLFIFPAMFIVILGPAVMQIMQVFSQSK
jgi:tight adherence protein C